MTACPEILQTPWHPPVGVFIGALGFLGIVVPLLREKIGHIEKALWTVLLAACLILELRSIHLDQLQHDREQAAASCQQLHSFMDIAKGLQEATSQSNDQFHTTIDSVNGVLTTTRQVAKIAESNLNELSGYGSYPCVIPDQLGTTDGLVPFSIWNRGMNILTGVEVSIHNDREYQAGRLQGRFNNVVIGTLPPEWPKTIPAISPSVGDDGIGYYQLEIWTQNGVYDEEINFRKAQRGNSRWAFQYWLEKQVVLKGPTKTFQKAHKGDRTSELLKGCYLPKWSDGSRDQ